MWLRVVNLTNAKQTVTLTARHSNGSVISGSKNPATIEDIPAFGSSRQSLANLFSMSVTELTRGVITVKGGDTLRSSSWRSAIFQHPVWQCCSRTSGSSPHSRINCGAPDVNSSAVWFLEQEPKRCRGHDLLCRRRSDHDLKYFIS